MSHQIHTYTELRQQIHDDLRIQHPEWVEPNGESPMCDSYESRLTELLDTLTQSESICKPEREEAKNMRKFLEAAPAGSFFQAPERFY